MLAGLNAMSAASTYPIVRIGDPDLDHGTDLTKEVKDEGAVIEDNLNPGFFKTYELDAEFPEDWKLDILIM